MRRFIVKCAAALLLGCAWLPVYAKGGYSKITLEGDFTSLKISSAFQVTLEYSDECTAVITVPEKYAEYIDADIKGGELSIGLDAGGLKGLFKRLRFNGNEELVATVTCPVLEKVRLSGASYLMIEDSFETASLRIQVSGASSLISSGLSGKGDMDIVLSGASHVRIDQADYENISAGVSGASTLFFKGSAQVFDIGLSGASNSTVEGDFSMLAMDLSGASDMNAKGNSDSLQISASGASTVEAREMKAEIADVVASGSSDVYIDADKLGNANSSGASRIVNGH